MRWRCPRPSPGSTRRSRSLARPRWRAGSVTATAELRCWPLRQGCRGARPIARSRRLRLCGTCPKRSTRWRRAGCRRPTPSAWRKLSGRPALQMSNQTASCWPRLSRCALINSPKRPAAGWWIERVMAGSQSTSASGLVDVYASGTQMTGWCTCTASSTQSPDGASATGCGPRPAASMTPTRNTRTATARIGARSSSAWPTPSTTSPPATTRAEPVSPSQTSAWSRMSTTPPPSSSPRSPAATG